MSLDGPNRIKPCPKVLKWWKTKYANNLQKAWEECKRGDLMFELLLANTKDHKKVVLTACKCVRRLGFKNVSVGEEFIRAAIETTEAWCRNETTLEEVNHATYTVISEVPVSSCVAAAAGYASTNPAYAVFSLADARTGNLAECADIVREDWPNVP